MATFKPTFDGTSDVGVGVEIPMKRLIRKGPGLAAAQATYLNIAHIVEPNTTLNQKLGILPDVHHTFGADTYFLGHFSIGVKGYQPGVGSQGEPMSIPYTSNPNDLDLFYTIPIVMRPVSNPLTQEEEKPFGLKRTNRRDGVDYFEYYSCALNTSESVADTFTRNAGADAKLIPYEYKPEDLSPEPKLAPAEGNTVKETSSMVVLTPVKAHFSAFAVAEIKNSMNILFGGVRTISEISFIQAAERNVEDTDGESQIYTRRELIDAQIGMSGVTGIEIAGTNAAIPATYRLGGGEAIYSVE